VDIVRCMVDPLGIEWSTGGLGETSKGFFYRSASYLSMNLINLAR